jgi:hypothetical protein
MGAVLAELDLLTAIAAFNNEQRRARMAREPRG